jgi:hypothetical protein
MSDWSSFEKDKKIADAWRKFLNESEERSLQELDWKGALGSAASAAVGAATTGAKGLGSAAKAATAAMGRNKGDYLSGMKGRAGTKTDIRAGLQGMERAFPSDIGEGSADYVAYLWAAGPQVRNPDIKTRKGSSANVTHIASQNLRKDNFNILIKTYSSTTSLIQDTARILKYLKTENDQQDIMGRVNSKLIPAIERAFPNPKINKETGAVEELGDQRPVTESDLDDIKQGAAHIAQTLRFMPQQQFLPQYVGGLVKPPVMNVFLKNAAQGFYIDHEMYKGALKAWSEELYEKKEEIREVELSQWSSFYSSIPGT